MPIIAGTLSSRVWRVADPLPPGFNEQTEKMLKRYAFSPVQPEKGQMQSMGWVNIRQVLDARMTLSKALFHNIMAVALRVDKITINQRLFRATMAQEVAKIMREKKGVKITRDQRAAIEEQVRERLLKEQAPNMAIYEMAWHLESGIVFFSATGDKLNMEFSDLFSQTFGVTIEPQFPFIRAEKWARKQRQERELIDLLPAPFSPRAPKEVVQELASVE